MFRMERPEQKHPDDIERRRPESNRGKDLKILTSLSCRSIIIT